MSVRFVGWIFKICPTFKLLFVKLLSFFILSGVVLYFLAMEYKVSPLFTTLVVFWDSSGGMYERPLYVKIAFMTASANSL